MAPSHFRGDNAGAHACRARDQLEVKPPLPAHLDTMRADIIDHFKPCMTDIYIHIDARMADYIRTHPYVMSSSPAIVFLRQPQRTVID